MIKESSGGKRGNGDKLDTNTHSFRTKIREGLLKNIWKTCEIKMHDTYRTRKKKGWQEITDERSIYAGK